MTCEVSDLTSTSDVPKTYLSRRLNFEVFHEILGIGCWLLFRFLTLAHCRCHHGGHVEIRLRLDSPRCQCAAVRTECDRSDCLAHRASRHCAHHVCHHGTHVSQVGDFN